MVDELLTYWKSSEINVFPIQSKRECNMFNLSTTRFVAGFYRFDFADGVARGISYNDGSFCVRIFESFDLMEHVNERFVVANGK